MTIERRCIEQLRELRRALDEVLDSDIAPREEVIMAIATVIRQEGGEMKETSLYACHVTALAALAIKRAVAEHDAVLAAQIAEMGKLDVNIEDDHMAADDILMKVAAECGYVKTAEAFHNLTKAYA